MPILLYSALALGAAGLYLALRGRRRRLADVGLFLVAAALAGLIVLGVMPLAGGAERGGFIVLALVGLVGAIRTITHTKAVYCALYFILVAVSTTGLLILLNAEFPALALLIIYAGAILVTYIFVIMLAQQGRPALYDVQARDPLLGVIAGFVLLAVITAATWRTPPPAVAEPDPLAVGTPLNIGVRLMTEYVVVVQMAGVLLLAALVGAIAIARRRPETLGEGEGA